MQTILLEKIGGLGNLGDIITVKNGYVRNFLIPAGRAKCATEANMKGFEAYRAELEAKQAGILADAKAHREKLEGQTITVAQRAGVDGRLFGSVTNVDITEAIATAGIQVAKANVRLPNGPLKTAGKYEVEVALHTNAVAKITVAVVAAAE